MKVRLHLRGDEKVEVVDPKAGKVIVHNLTFDACADGQPDGTFAAAPAGIVHVNNVSEAVAQALKVGADYTIEPA